MIAIDRPGYAESTALLPAEATVEHNADRLSAAITHIWKNAHLNASGIVLIGHSIGGAIAIDIASRSLDWPLLGLAISGIGLLTPPSNRENPQQSGMSDAIESPPAFKDTLMFGPPYTVNSDMPALSRLADAPVPRAERDDIRSTWSRRFHGLAARVPVAVHYRQAQFDLLWISDPENVRQFGAAFTTAPSVDARLFPSAGHCIDFHRIGIAFQLAQLAFAMRVSATAPRRAC